jgi:hypothetical protein
MTQTIRASWARDEAGAIKVVRKLGRKITACEAKGYMETNEQQLLKM